MDTRQMAARYRTDDLVREAEAHRTASALRSGRGPGHGRLRRAAVAALALVAWPARH